MRIGITGGPKTGKTTLAKKMHRDRVNGVRVLLHTDDLIDLGWSESSQRVSEWLEEFTSVDDLIIEGVTLPRALRKWLKAHPEGRPLDKLLVLDTTYGELSPGQERMAKGVETVVNEIADELIKRGVEVSVVWETGVIGPQL